MASPVADSYSCASGGVIHAGKIGTYSWRSAIPPLTWAVVGGNTIDDVDPARDSLVNPNYPGVSPWTGANGHASVISAWCGAVWDESRKRLYITGGGHADYAGNEVYQWDAQTALFSRLNTPSGAIGNTGVLNDGLDQTSPCYFDGRPRSAHTYGNLALRDGVFWNFQGSTYSSGFGVCSPFRFENNDWVRDTNVFTGTSYGHVLWDESRSRFLINGSGNGRPAYYDPITKATGQMAHWSNNDAQECPGVLDTRRDLVIQLSHYITILLLNDTSDAVVMTQSGTIPNWSANEQGDSSRASAIYDYANDRFFVITVGDPSIYILTPPSLGSNYLTATWTWSKLDPAAENTITPTQTAHGSYGRFWHSPSLDCLGVVNATTQKMYIFSLG